MKCPDCRVVKRSYKAYAAHRRESGHNTPVSYTITILNNRGFDQPKVKPSDPYMYRVPPLRLQRHTFIRGIQYVEHGYPL